MGGGLIADKGVAPALLSSISAFIACAGASTAGVMMSKLVEWPVLRLRDRFFPTRLTPLPRDHVQPQEHQAPVGALPLPRDAR